MSARCSVEALLHVKLVIGKQVFLHAMGAHVLLVNSSCQRMCFDSVVAATGFEFDIFTDVVVLADPLLLPGPLLVA